MTSERSSLPGLIPSSVERNDLRVLIDRSLKDGDYKTGSPSDELHAMIDVSFHYSSKIRKILNEHLKKMIIIHYELISPPNPVAQGVLFNSFSPSMLEQHRHFMGFKEDLSDMTEPWQAAMHDVLEPINDEARGLIE